MPSSRSGAAILSSFHCIRGGCRRALRDGLPLLVAGWRYSTNLLAMVGRMPTSPCGRCRLVACGSFFNGRSRFRTVAGAANPIDGVRYATTVTSTAVCSTVLEAGISAPEKTMPGPRWSTGHAGPSEQDQASAKETQLARVTVNWSGPSESNDCHVENRSVLHRRRSVMRGCRRHTGGTPETSLVAVSCSVTAGVPPCFAARWCSGNTTVLQTASVPSSILGRAIRSG